MSDRSITDIVADLSKPRPEYVKTKEAKNKRTNSTTTIRFFEWHSAVRILDECAPGWSSEVKQVIDAAGKIAAIVRISVPCAEGVVWREALGNEDDDHEGFGDPFSNAEAMAFKRAAAKFGVGLYLYQKDAPAATRAPERPAAPRTAPQAPAARPEPSGSLCSLMQVKTIAGLLRETGRDVSAIKAHYKVTQLSELTEGQADATIAQLKKRLAEQSAPALGDVLEGVEDRPNLSGVRS